MRVIRYLEPIGGRKRVLVQTPDVDRWLDTLKREGEGGRLGPGDRAVDPYGKAVEIVRRLDSVRGRERVRVRMMSESMWLDHLEHPKRPAPDMPIGHAPPVGSETRAKDAPPVFYVIGDRVEVQRTGGKVVRGVVKAEIAPGVNGQRQYDVRFDKTGKTWPTAADSMRLIREGE